MFRSDKNSCMNLLLLPKFELDSSNGVMTFIYQQVSSLTLFLHKSWSSFHVLEHISMCQMILFCQDVLGKFLAPMIGVINLPYTSVFPGFHLLTVLRKNEQQQINGSGSLLSRL